MDDRISCRDAVALLIKKKRGTIADNFARRALVANLQIAGINGIAESYWRSSIPPLSNRAKLEADMAPYGACVPMDFWRPEHAFDVPDQPASGYVPSHYGKWSEGTFSSDIQVSGSAIAAQYPDFAELSYLGTGTIEIQLCAVAVTFSRTEIEQMADMHLPSIIKKADRQPTLRLGNMSKSDVLDLYAMVCVRFLPDDELYSIAEGDTGQIVKALGEVAALISEGGRIHPAALMDMTNRLKAAAHQLLAPGAPPI